ncbi:hypothetical protein [Iodobacter sp. BJB302]|uniref:hypothetical protein n=1 Tax=Iodobacter sp. BJB302 TaxID=1506510 RepID=UPI000C0D720A|nr:hypothetical protein [Iodobacter sp. BJB302]PHU99795.1 hypothetical protein CSQ88_20545 [Iodobacter sp. BJB302]
MEGVVQFNAMELIEINVGKNLDGTIRRRLVMVDQSGWEYRDLLDDPAAMVYPIYASLHPERVGNSVGWSVVIYQNQGEDEYRKFGHLEDFLQALGLDSLTYSRALYWAKMTLNFDPMSVLEHGENETKAAWGDRLGFTAEG